MSDRQQNTDNGAQQQPPQSSTRLERAYFSGLCDLGEEDHWLLLKQWEKTRGGDWKTVL